MSAAKKFLLGIVLAMSALVGVSGDAGALSVTSPDFSGPAIPTLFNGASAGVNRSQYHVIASADSNDGRTLGIAAYMTNYDPNRRIRIYAPTQDIWASVECDRDSSVGPGSTAIEVRMSGPGLTSLTYSVPNSKTCSPNGVPTPEEANLRSSPTNASFWGTYQLPAGTPTIDPETGMYKVNIVIRYTSAVYTDPGSSASMVFRSQLLRSPAEPNLPPGSILGTTASGSSFGVGSTTDVSASSEYYRHAFDFGTPCSQVANVSRTITIRDPDNYSTGAPSWTVASTQGGGTRVPARPMELYITEDGVPLAAARYSVPAGEGTVTGSPAVVTPTTVQVGGLSGNTNITITMQPGRAYRLIAQEVYYRNIIQVLLPTDAVYNGITCPAADFELQPSITDLPDSMVPGETSVGPIEGRVDNTGADPTPTATLAGIARYVYRGSGSLATSGDTVGGITTAANYSCRIVEAENLETPAPQECVALWEGSAAAGITNDTLLQSIASFNPSSISPALEVGHQVCFVAVVNRYNESVGETDWRYSDPVCIKVAKIPFVHVEGHDIRVGSALDAANNRESIVAGLGVLSGGNLYSSRGEYAIFAPGNSTGFSSGFSISPTTADRNRLTFSNDSMYGNFVDPGDLAALGTIPNVANYFFDGGVPTAANIRPEISSSVTYSQTGTINNTNVTNSRVFFNNSSINIQGNVTVNQVASPSQIRQAVIIANGDINIRSNVTRIDAWLVSIGGTINTCTPPGSSAPLSTSSPFCTGALTVNGPIMANRLVLRRTAGADNMAQLNNPAERINLPASTFLWGHQMEQRTGSLQTTYTRELPPRF